MSGYGVGPSSVPWAKQAWEDLSELMERTRSDLASASATGLAPSVRTAASAFLTAWSGHAKESTAMADGFVDALDSINARYGAQEQLSEEQLRNLDGRLGPAR